VKTVAFLTAAALLAVTAVGVAAGFVFTIAHATVRVLETLGGTP
jgi:hypothetical protein